MLMEYHEKWGVARLWEVLESVEWPQRNLKKNPITQPEHRMRHVYDHEASFSHLLLFHFRLKKCIENYDKEEVVDKYSGPILEDDTHDPDIPDSEDEGWIHKCKNCELVYKITFQLLSWSSSTNSI